ncbi:hypothetical protein POM88_000769 [Heracleum sosnowskyi]|uniref:F-box domain-containing protein n=1 Tax=Heracleum sosnowskyi TaxID=360622 RepID=A0AAD8N912_9APIA|nr:hypothetical protein POM88_000769 [Heracleum sosnowskyi]
MDNLPEHVLVENILLLLPVKSLVCMRSVCKSWRSRILNPDFIELQWRKQWPMTTRFCFDVSSSDYKVVRIVVEHGLASGWNRVENKGINIWTLDDDSCWIKKFTITMRPSSITEIVGCLKTGEFVGKKRVGDQPFLYDPVNNVQVLYQATRLHNSAQALCSHVWLESYTILGHEWMQIKEAAEKSILGYEWMKEAAEKTRHVVIMGEDEVGEMTCSTASSGNDMFMFRRQPEIPSIRWKLHQRVFLMYVIPLDLVYY